VHSEDEAFDYNGNAQYVTKAEASADDRTAVTIEYSVKGEDGYGEWSTTVPSLIDADSLTYKVRALNANYVTVEDETEYTLKINQLAINVYDSMLTEYNGEDQTLTITADKATGVLNDETLTLENATITGRDAEPEAYTVLDDEYTWSVTKADGSDSTNNYTIDVTGSLKINKKKVTITADSIEKPWGADDPEEGFTAKPDGLVEGDEIEYTVKRVPGEIAVTAVTSSDDETIAYDEYEIYVEIEEGKEPKNYDPELVPGKLTIKKTPVIIRSSIEGLEEVYSGTIVTLRAEMAGLDDFPNNYAYQWQIADEEDGEYVDIIENAQSREYEYVLNKDTAGKHYRVVITLTK
jgi:hypothetical protein